MRVRAIFRREISLKLSRQMLIGLLMIIGLGAAGQDARSESTTEQPLNLPAVAPVVDCAALAAVDVSQAVGAPVKISSA